MKRITIWCLLGGNPNRYQPVFHDTRPIIISGLPHEGAGFVGGIMRYSAQTSRYIRGEERAFDTVTNFSRDIRLMLEKEFGHYDEITLLIPTSPTHFWRAEKIVKMLSHFYPIFHKVKLEKVDSYIEEDGKMESMMRFIYRVGGWVGIMGLCFIARLQGREK